MKKIFGFVLVLVIGFAWTDIARAAPLTRDNVKGIVEGVNVEMGTVSVREHQTGLLYDIFVEPEDLAVAADGMNASVNYRVQEDGTFISEGASFFPAGSVSNNPPSGGAVSAQAVLADEVLSANIAEADGTTGQKTNVGSGIKTRHIQNGAIATAKIRNKAVKTWKIDDGAVTNAKIVDDAVNSAKIEDGSVGTLDLASGAVTDDKITGPVSGTKIGGTVPDADTVDGQHAADLGDITSVNTGLYLSGGGTSGDVTVDVKVPLDITGDSGTKGIIEGKNQTGYGLVGYNLDTGNWGRVGTSSAGLRGFAWNLNGVGVTGFNNMGGNQGWLGTYTAGVYGKSTSGLAGDFDGNARVTGDLEVQGVITGESDPTVNSLGKAPLSCSNGQVPKMIGTSWQCAPDNDTDTTYTAGNGLLLNGTQFEATSPFELTDLRDAGAVIRGNNTGAGQGLYGASISGQGVYGLAVTGRGVSGIATSSGGVGGYFTSLAGPALIVDSGNVGIGTTVPEAGLDVVGAFIQKPGNYIYDFDSQTNYIIGYSTPRCPCDTDSEAWECNAGPGVFYSITDAGPTCYDWDSPGFTNISHVYNRAATTRPLIHTDEFGHVNIGTDNPALAYNKLYVEGNIYATGSITPGSSRELKEDIRSLSVDEAFNTLALLEPQKFFYKADRDDEHIGFIAEDVPDLVAAKGRKGVAPMDIVAVLTKVLQEQQRTIERMNRELTDMRRLLDRVNTNPL